MLAVEIAVADASTPTTLGLAIARILGIADRLLEESGDWLWIGGRIPDPGDRTVGQRRLPRPLRGAAAGAAGSRDADGSPGPRRSRVVAATGLLALAVPAPAEVRAADART